MILLIHELLLQWNSFFCYLIMVAISFYHLMLGLSLLCHVVRLVLPLLMLRGVIHSWYLTTMLSGPISLLLIMFLWLLLFLLLGRLMVMFKGGSWRNVIIMFVNWIGEKNVVSAIADKWGAQMVHSLADVACGWEYGRCLQNISVRHQILLHARWLSENIIVITACWVRGHKLRLSIG